MKNKSLTKLTAIVLLVTMIALAIISGTFAKYTTSYDGTGTAIVAKWKVSIKDEDGAAFSSSTTTVDLFDVSKVYDLNGVTGNDVTALTATDDEHVANGNTVASGGDGKAIVAPGTWGKVGFTVEIAADNEVTVNYGVDVTNLSTDLPLEFSLDGKTWVSASTITTAITNDGKYSLGTNTVAPKTAESKTAVLYWKWDYEVGADANAIANNDASDTALGTAGTATCTISAKAVATQVD